MSKVCNKCKVFKKDYHKDSSKKDGLCTICADCKKQNAKRWVEENPEKAKEQRLQWYNKNKDLEEFRLSRSENHKNWLQNNRDKKCAKEAKRRASKLTATPSWLSDAQIAKIKRIYKISSFMSSETGVQYHVDHIVPLKGKNVCGLHVPWNLQVIPAKDNLKKGNRFT